MQRSKVKGRFTELMERIPVHVVVTSAGLTGAVNSGVEMLNLRKSKPGVAPAIGRLPSRFRTRSGSAGPPPLNLLKPRGVSSDRCRTPIGSFSVHRA
jgi:hypothetical protein